MEYTKIAPLVIKPSRINNYTHLIAALKTKQSKYKDCTYKPIANPFNKVLTVKKEAFSATNIIEGYLHEKIRDRFFSLEKEVAKTAYKFIDSRIAELKKDNDQFVYNKRIGNIKDSEGLLFSRPTKYSFKDELLFDLYNYLSSRMKPLEFLEKSFLKYIKSFVQVQGKQQTPDKSCESENVSNVSVEDKNALKNLVKEFVRLKYNRVEYGIEVYEGRYLWAELFVLFRLGRKDLVAELLNEFEIFFEFMGQKFRTIFTAYIENRTSSIVPTVLPRDDKFKKFLVDLVDGRFTSDGFVVATVEDYIWCKLITKKDIKKDAEFYENQRIKFMILLFSKKYKEAIDVMLRSDFSIVAKFYLLKEICLERGLDVNSKENELDLSLSKVNPVFLNFMFGIVSRLSTTEQKVRFIEILKPYPGYFETVAEYIIKYDLFDTLNINGNNSGELSLSLDNQMANVVIEKLKKSGNRQKLIHLNSIIAPEVMAAILIDFIEEAILTDEKIDEKLVEQTLLKISDFRTTKLRDLFNLYKFNISPTIATLKSTVILDLTRDLNEYKYIIEKIFSKAVDVAKVQQDKEICKTLFKLCGILELNEECGNKASKDLVAFI